MYYRGLLFEVIFKEPLLFLYGNGLKNITRLTTNSHQSAFLHTRIYEDKSIFYRPYFSVN
jgi:hypothetical protein